MQNSRKNSISRRDFLKGTAAGALSLATVGVLNACNAGSNNAVADTTPAAAPTPATAEADTAGSAASGTYIPGTYSASTKGMGMVTHILL